MNTNIRVGAHSCATCWHWARLGAGRLYRHVADDARGDAVDRKRFGALARRRLTEIATAGLNAAGLPVKTTGQSDLMRKGLVDDF